MTSFVTIALLKSAATLPPAFGLIKNRRKFLPEENAKHSLAAVMTLAEKATAAAIVAIAAIVKTTAVPAETIAETAEIAAYEN